MSSGKIFSLTSSVVFFLWTSAHAIIGCLTAKMTMPFHAPVLRAEQPVAFLVVGAVYACLAVLAAFSAYDEWQTRHLPERQD